MNKDNQVELGECINFWIERKGWLDLDTDESVIRAFYDIEHNSPDVDFRNKTNWEEHN